MSHIYAYGLQAPSAKAIIHLGATSAFVTDNTDILQMAEGLAIMKQRIVSVMAKLRDFAWKWRATPQLAFTHFQPAQLTTGRQARDALAARPSARLSRDRVPSIPTRAPRREGSDRHAGVVPQPVRGRRNESQSTRAARGRKNRNAKNRSGLRADVFAQVDAQVVGAVGIRAVGVEIRLRHAPAAAHARDRGAVRGRAGRLFGDGVQAQSDARGAHRRAGAASDHQRAQSRDDRRDAMVRAHARRLRQPPHRDSRRRSWLPTPSRCCTTTSSAASSFTKKSSPRTSGASCRS